MTLRLIDVATRRTAGTVPAGGPVSPGEVIPHGRGNRWIVQAVRIDPDVTRVWVDRI